MKKHLSRTAPALVLAGFLLSCIPALARATSNEPPVEILHLAGNDPCGLFGFSAGGVGDFNGDGYQDFAVSEPFGSGVHVYWGGPNADSLADLHLRDGGYGLLGVLTASAGDFNGDGFDDIVAGLQSGSTRFWVYFRGRSPDSLPDLPLAFPGSAYAVKAVAAGDVNRDGYPDLIVGYERPYSPGRVFVHYGGPGADGLPDLELNAIPDDLLLPEDIGPAGWKIATADWNGDGVADIIVSSLSGLRVYYGGPGLDGLEDFRLTVSQIDGQRMAKFAPAGDVNGDGAGDIMVATADQDGLQGRVRIYFGGAQMDSIPDVTLHAQDPAGMFGPAMTNLGDTNGDGYADVLVGTNFDGAGGRADLFHGGAPMDTIPYSSVTNWTRGSFGAVLGASDVNSDGVPDALVSILAECGGTAGDVFVYDFSTPLQARAFVQGHRTIHLGKPDTPVCVRLEPVGQLYEIADIDISSIQLTTGLASIRPIPPSAVKRAVVGDTDRNGLSEFPLWFATSDLVNLFGSIRGRTVVQAQLKGKLTSHRRFAAPVTMTMIGKPDGPHASSAWLAPNPMNPVGKLFFNTRESGFVSVRVYDVSGRLVRTILSQQRLNAGSHATVFDGRDREGAEIGSGVYFFRIDTAEGPLTGRFVIAR